MPLPLHLSQLRAAVDPCDVKGIGGDDDAGAAIGVGDVDEQLLDVGEDAARADGPLRASWTLRAFSRRACRARLRRFGDETVEDCELSDEADDTTVDVDALECRAAAAGDDDDNSRRRERPDRLLKFRLERDRTASSLSSSSSSS